MLTKAVIVILLQAPPRPVAKIKNALKIELLFGRV